MKKSLNDIRKAAKDFAKKWKGKGRETSDAQTFVEDLLEDVFGIDHARNQIIKEIPIKVNHKTKKGDIYVTLSKTIVEMKSHDVSLDDKEKQSDGTCLTPMEQGKRYYDWLNKQDQGNYIVACNFQEFRIFDNRDKTAPQTIIQLEDLPEKISRLRFLVEPEHKAEDNDEPISKKASEFVSQLYKLLQKANPKPDRTMLHSMNVFCVRVVFCLYADDAGVFDDAQFHNFILSTDGKRLTRQFDDLFRWLDDAEHKGEYASEELKAFPYVDGGLFQKDENYKTPVLTDKIRKHLLDAWNLKLDDGKDFHWSEISPTNFGCIFESTADSSVREQGGMHYTTPSNIHKLIDPLFLNDLRKELDEIKNLPCDTRQEKTKVTDSVDSFRNKISSILFLDPACGSCNFLTESYKSLYTMELEAIRKEINDGYATAITTTVDPCMVKIDQFFGIEIEDFAAQVAKAALWIAECQMRQKCQEMLDININTLPLNKNANIACADALTTDWLSIFGRKLKSRTFLYIIGNPPFMGGKKKTQYQSQSQKIAMPSKIDGEKVWKKQGSLDFVCGWYAKSAEIIRKRPSFTRMAFVSTNSIIQGEQNAPLWQPLLNQYKLHIDFAWRSFRWFNKVDDMAHVHCVIIALSKKKINNRIIFEEGKEPLTTKNINNYLLPAENLFIWKKSKPLSSVPKIGIGNKPIDGGNYIFTNEEKDAFLKKEPDAQKYFHPYYGAEEFINNSPRWILWLGGCTTSELASLPECSKRVEAVRQYRRNSKSAPTRELASSPRQFHVEYIPKCDYLLIPRTSSEKRDYIPMGYMAPYNFSSDGTLIGTGFTLFHFGVLQSRLHMAWVKVVCGRLEERFRYSAGVVYNCFPWPDSITDEQKEAINNTAQRILDARSEDPDATLANYYDNHSLNMSDNLRMAHEANNKAVAEAFDISESLTDEEIALELMRRSVILSDKQNPPKRKKKKKKKKKKKENDKRKPQTSTDKNVRGVTELFGH